MDSLKLFQMALAQGISIAPGPIFSATQRFRKRITLNYGSPWICFKGHGNIGQDQ